MISLLTVIFLVVTVMLWFDERGKDTDGGNYASWSTPNFPTSFWTSPFWIFPVKFGMLSHLDCYAI